MNDATPGGGPDRPGPGRRPLPGPPRHGPAASGPVRRPLAAPGSPRPDRDAGPYGTPVPATRAPESTPEPVEPVAAPAPAGGAGPEPQPDTPEADTPGTETSAEAGPGPQDDGPQPLGVRIEPTGDPDVDARLRRLEDADHLAVSGHLEVYEDVHRGLRDTLTALDRHETRS